MLPVVEIELFRDQNNLVRNLDQMPAVVRALLLEKAKSWVNAIEDRVRDLIVERLGERSGELLANVESEVYEQDGRIVARVFIDSDKVPYARAQEQGATIPPHIIRPREAKILAFYAATGEKVFATRVFHPGATIAGKHFMRDAKRQSAAQISKDIKKTVVEGIRRSMRGTA